MIDPISWKWHCGSYDLCTHYLWAILLCYHLLDRKWQQINALHFVLHAQQLRLIVLVGLLYFYKPSPHDQTDCRPYIWCLGVRWNFFPTSSFLVAFFLLKKWLLPKTFLALGFSICVCHKSTFNVFFRHLGSVACKTFKSSAIDISEKILFSLRGNFQLKPLWKRHTKIFSTTHWSWAFHQATWFV